MLHLWCWMMTICWIVIVVQSEVLEALLQGQEGVVTVSETFSPTFFTAVVVAPLQEEFFFRGWITSRGRYLLVGLPVFLCWLMSTIVSPGGLSGLGVVSFFLLAFVATTSWLLDIETGLAPGGRAPWFVGLLVVLVFALVHLFNYSRLDVAWYVQGMLVLPQFFLGVFALLARIRFGLLAAMAMHALYNAELSIVTDSRFFGFFLLMLLFRFLVVLRDIVLRFQERSDQ